MTHASELVSVVLTSQGCKQLSEKDPGLGDEVANKMAAIHRSYLGLLMVQGIPFTFSKYHATQQMAHTI